MNIKLSQSKIHQNTGIAISGSKSETNRLLLLKALYPAISLENASNSDDSEVMANALALNLAPNTLNPSLIDIHHAGTAMRFLTAYFAIQENQEVVITGSSRMKQRPIKILVEALQKMGAEITYQEKEGFPPIKIIGKKLVNSKVSLLADTSSQYISALLLIAPKLENGLELALEGKITSLPYIKMTLALLDELGIETEFVDNTIKVKPQPIIHKSQFIIESDWSSASYFYSIVALSEIGTTIKLSSYKYNSLQGDSILSEIYKDFGVQTIFNMDNSITISKGTNSNLKYLSLDLNQAPDIAQTITVTCFGLGIGCQLTGLHTLKIKETDRLEALRIELGKLGAKITVTNNSLTLETSAKIESGIEISTYNDHRMAMAFAPLALKTDITIQDAEVVSKSYPAFWNDLKNIGFNIS